MTDYGTRRPGPAPERLPAAPPPPVAEPSRGMSYDRLIEDEVATLGPSIEEELRRQTLPGYELRVCTVEIVVDKIFRTIRSDVLAKLAAATGIADVVLEQVGPAHTRVILRPTQREARSLIASAVYHDVVNGVNQ